MNRIFYMAMLLVTWLSFAPSYADDVVAKIGETDFATLQEAFDAVETGQTITMLTNVTLSAPLNVELADKAVTLDLGDHTLTGRTNLKSGNLTLTNGNVAGGIEQALNVYGSSEPTEDYSVLTIGSDVNVTADVYGVCLFGATYSSNGYGAVVNINGHVTTTGDSKNGAVFVSGNLGQNISGDMHNVINIAGRVTSATDAAVALNGNATVNVQNGAQITGNTGIAVKRGTLNVEGGTIVGNGANNTTPGANYNGTEMTGAGISMSPSYSQYGPMSVVITGGTVNSSNAQALFKQAGTYQSNATFSVSGGTFSSAVPEEFCAKGYALADNGNGTFTVQKAAVAKIGDYKYASLAEAIEAATNDATITLLEDIVLAKDVHVTTSGENIYCVMVGGSYQYQVAAPQLSSLTIDGNGHTITMGADAAFGSQYRLQDGCAFFFGKYGSNYANTGTVEGNYTIQNVTFTGFDTEIIRSANATVNLVNCTFTGNHITKEVILTGNPGTGDGTNMLYAYQGALNVDGCTFTDNTVSNAKYGLIFSNNSNTAATITINNSLFKNNGTAQAPTGGNGLIYLSNAASSTDAITNNTFEGNYVQNASNNAAVVYLSKPVETFSGNLFKDNHVNVTSSGRKEGVIVLGSNAAGTPVIANAFVDNVLDSNVPEKLATIVVSCNSDLSNNYWGDGEAPETGRGLDIYVDGEKTITNTDFASAYVANTESQGATVTLPVYVAQIGSTTYPSLAKAIAAVPTDGTQTTITMIGDETVAGGSTLTIADTKNIVLDLNGKTITGSSTTSSSNFYFITNKGKLEITDNSEGALGKITYGCSAATYSNEFVTICNEGGTFTLTNGTIENTSGGLSYAVNTRSVAQGIATFNLNGGTISAPSGDAAIRVYQSVYNASSPYDNIVNVTGGTILNSGIFVDSYIGNNVDGSNSHLNVNISGGTVNGLIDYKLRHPYNIALNITGGDFENAKLWVRKYTSEYKASTEPTAPIVHISGGKFSFENNKAFGLAYDCGATSWTSYTQPYDVSDGVFNVNLNNFSGIAFPEGKTGVANTDSETSEAYPYTVGVAPVAQIGSTTYPSLAAAIAAVDNGEEIKMIANSNENVLYDVTSPNLKNKTVTISGEYTLTSPDGDFGFYFGDYDNGNRPTTDKLNVSGITMAKSGGNYTTLFDGVTADLTNVTVNGDGNTALSYANGAVGTLTNVTVTNTGNHSQTWRNTALALQSIRSASEVTVKSGSYTSVNGYAVYMFSSGGTLNIEGGTFSGALMSQIDNKSYPDKQSIINISGGTFANCTLTESGGENAQIYVSGGTFSINPTAYVLPGYAAVETVIDNTTWWKVGEVVTGDMTKQDGATATQATYTVETQVVDGNEVLSTTTNTTVTVAIAGENNVAVDAELDDLKMDNVVSKSVKEVPGNDINVKIAVVATAETPAVENTLVFEVHPEATVYVSNVKQGTVELENSDLATGATFTFKLPVAGTFENGTEVKVVHKSSDPATYPDETFYATVSDGKVTITVSHFSDFELSAVQQFSELDVKLEDGKSYEECVGRPVTADVVVHSASYVRTVRDNFCAWYVPFNYTLTSSDINDINFYRINLIANAVAGTEVTSTDQIWVYLTRMEAGEKLTANRPYVFKAKSGSWEQTFTTSGATLCAPATDVRLNNSTTAHNYDFYGTYETTELSDNSSEHFFYVSSNGRMGYPGGYDINVGPYRWYIKTTQKGGGAYYAPTFVFTDDPNVTGITDNLEVKTIDCYYDLKGMKIEKPSKGAYLVKFKDGTVKKVVK